MKTDTPRTDAQEATTRNPHYDPEEAEQLAWDVARMFERELFGASERLAALNRRLCEMRDSRDALEKAWGDATAENAALREALQTARAWGIAHGGYDASYARRLAAWVDGGFQGSAPIVDDGGGA